MCTAPRAALLIFISVLLSMAACSPEAAPSPTVAPTDTPAPTAESTPASETPQTQQIEFTADDGGKLVGLYFPAAADTAPVVVLMHQAGASQYSISKEGWEEAGFVAWLNNSGGGSAHLQAPAQGGIFPPMPAGRSFAVFTFDYRGFGESDPIAANVNPIPLWVADSLAAVETAKTLPGADPERVIAVGGSLGADGAVIACGEVPGCLGAIALSPGNFLDRPFNEAVEVVDDQDHAVLCMAAENDSPSPQTCRGATGNHYQSFIIPGMDHGVDLYNQTGLDPSPGQMTLDFLLAILP